MKFLTCKYDLSKKIFDLKILTCKNELSNIFFDLKNLPCKKYVKNEMVYVSKMDLDETGPIPTDVDVKKTCSALAVLMKKLGSLQKEDTAEFHSLCEKILAQVTTLENMTQVEGFTSILFASELYPFIDSLISIPDTEISSKFLSILTDIAENPDNIERIIKQYYFKTAIKSAEIIDEINIQSDAQFLYSIFTLISTVIDGCDEPKAFIDSITQDSPLITLIHRQFNRDDFDQNVLAASELLAILLQLQPATMKFIDEGFVNLILRFCANMRKTKNAEEDEAASNAFNIVVILAMDPVEVKILANLGVIDILLACIGSSSSKEEKSSSKLAYNAIEACLTSSPVCCEQFVDAGGIKKVFGLLGNKSLTKNFETLSNVISIIDSLLTSLPTDSVHLKRVLRKFIEKEYEKLFVLISLTEFLFLSIDFEEEDQSNADQYDTYLVCCSDIAILLALLPEEAKIALTLKIRESEVIDPQLVVDSALERVETTKGLKDLVENGIKILNLLCEEK